MFHGFFFKTLARWTRSGMGVRLVCLWRVWPALESCLEDSGIISKVGYLKTLRGPYLTRTSGHFCYFRESYAMSGICFLAVIWESALRRKNVVIVINCPKNWCSTQRDYLGFSLCAISCIQIG